MDDLVAWLQAQIAEDEESARIAAEQVGDQQWQQRSCTIETSQGGEVASYAITEAIWHMINWDPARVLAECGAKRRMIAAVQQRINGHPGQCTNEGFEQDDACDLHVEWNKTTLNPYALRILAEPYADRPGYRSEWSIDG